MAVDFRSIGQIQVWSSATSASFVCPQPAGLTVGDLMVAAVLTNGVGVNLPAGWTDLYNLTAAGNPNQRVFYKVADATDVGTPSFTFTTTSATYGSAEICAYSGVDQTTPIDFTCIPVDSSASLTAFTVAAVTVVTEGAVLVGGAGANTGVTTQVWTEPTTPGQWVDEWNPANGAGGAVAQSGGKSHVRGHYLTPLAAGSSTGAITFTLSVSRAGDAWFAGLRPDGSGGVVTPALLTRVVGIGDSPTTGRVLARVTNATAAKLKVATDSAMTTNVMIGPAVTPDADGNAHLTISGLTAGTKYYYRVVMTDNASTDHDDTAITIGSLRTAPVGVASFNVDFASCCNAADSDSMAAIGARDDDLFLHLGDFYYADGTGTDLANFKSKMLAKVSAGNHQAVFATRPLVYTPSDHDGMNNNSTAGTDPTAWANWNVAYREYIPTPAIPDTTGVYYTFTWGRVKFIVIDTSSFKDDPSIPESSTKTQFGATQKQWFKDAITAATEPLIIVVNAQPYVGAPISGDDSWLGFTTERTEMANFFAASGKNIVFTGGDQHCLAADDGSNSPGGVPIFHAAPLNNTASRKGGPYSAGQYPASGSSLVQQYGRLAITDDGSQISVSYTGYDSTNTAHITLTKSYTTAAPVSTGTASTSWVAAASAAGSAPIVPVKVGSASTAWVANTSGAGSAPIVSMNQGVASATWPAHASAAGSVIHVGMVSTSWGAATSASGSAPVVGTRQGTASVSWLAASSAHGTAPTVPVSAGTANTPWAALASAIGAVPAVPLALGQASLSWPALAAAIGLEPVAGVGPATTSWVANATARGSNGTARNIVILSWTSPESVWSTTGPSIATLATTPPETDVITGTGPVSVWSTTEPDHREYQTTGPSSSWSTTGPEH